jgi:hypothetical protein
LKLFSEALVCGTKEDGAVPSLHPKFYVMDEDEKIKELEGLIVDMRFDLKTNRDKEMIYLDILSNIDNSLKVLFKREQENERFDLGDDINYRECVVNLKSALDEYKRIYKLRL